MKPKRDIVFLFFLTSSCYLFLYEGQSRTRRCFARGQEWKEGMGDWGRGNLGENVLNLGAVFFAWVKMFLIGGQFLACVKIFLVRPQSLTLGTRHQSRPSLATRTTGLRIWFWWSLARGSGLVTQNFFLEKKNTWWSGSAEGQATCVSADKGKLFHSLTFFQDRQESRCGEYLGRVRKGTSTCWRGTGWPDTKLSLLSLISVLSFVVCRLCFVTAKISEK